RNASFQHQEEIIGVVVLVPHELSLELDHPQVVPVELTDRSRLPILGKHGELFREIDALHGSHLNARPVTPNAMAMSRRSTNARDEPPRSAARLHRPLGCPPRSAHRIRHTRNRPTPQAGEIGAGTFATAKLAPVVVASFNSIRISRKSWSLALIAVSVAPGGTKKTLPGCTGISTR